MNTRMMFVGLRWRLFRQGATGANLIATVNYHSGGSL